jgi:hypothetical protein
MINSLLRAIGRGLLRYLETPMLGYKSFDTTATDELRRTLKPGDVLLVDGNLRISLAIKYLSQSSWSHAALYIGSDYGLTDDSGTAVELVEADAAKGVIGVPLSKYAGFNTRICRPKDLQDSDLRQLLDFMASALGRQYDMKNVIDLIRYTFPQPPVPQKWRRQMIAVGSGEPSRAICSTLIAQAFQQVNYPILPDITRANAREIFHIRHHSLYTPRDFDLSPYFAVIKPTLENGFDYRKIEWSRRNQPQDVI